MIQVARCSSKPPSKSEKRLRSLIAHPARLLRFLGPGLVTGAADDVLTGTATYSRSGAQFGFVMLWTVVLSYPLMAAIQEASAWIARVSGAGLARNLRLHYPPWLNYHSRFSVLRQITDSIIQALFLNYPIDINTLLFLPIAETPRRKTLPRRKRQGLY